MKLILTFDHIIFCVLQEILGGLLELDPRRWKKPHKINNAREKAQEFAKLWEPYDITKQNE